MEELYVMVDCETTGPVPAVFSMWALSACLVDEPEIRFPTRRLKPLNGNYEPERLAISNVTMDELMRTGLPPRKVMREFVAWCEEAAKGRRLVFTGRNAPFDWMFVCWYLYVFTRRNPFGYDALDTKAYYMGMQGCSWNDTRRSKMDPCFLSDLPHTHDPLDDCLEQSDSFRKMRAYREANRFVPV